MKWVLTILILVALIAAGVFGYRKVTRKSGIEILETAVATRGDIRAVLVETGIIKPEVGAEVKIGARATGVVTEMLVKVGDRVKANQLIAVVDDREIQKAIEQQEAALASARNTLAQHEQTYPEKINEAEAKDRLARQTYRRAQQLIKKEYTTREDLDQARSEFEAAAANLKRLRTEFDTQLKIDRADVKKAAAELEQQQIRLSYTKVHAPIDGIVSDVTVQEGETIVTGLQVANLVTIIDPGRLEMWIYVDETDIGKVKVGQPVEYYVDAYADRTLSTTIERIHPQPEQKDNIVYYLAIAKVSRADAEWLRPEMTAHVKIVYDEKKGVLTVPNASVKFAGGRQVAYRVLGPGEVEKVPIKTGMRGEDLTEILSGVAEGEKLATKLILPVGPPSRQSGRRN